MSTTQNPATWSIAGGRGSRGARDARSGLINWLVPGHHLWVYQAPDGTISFEQRRRGEQAGEWWYPLLQASWQLKDELEVRLAVD